MKRNADMPMHPIHATETPIGGEGLSKREHIAAIAMAGLVTRGLHEAPDFVAKQAVRLADALLEHLDRPRLADLVEEANSLVPPPF